MTVPTWLRSRRVQLVLGVIVLLLVASWFLPAMLADATVEEAGGPPDPSVVPPFEEDTFAPLLLLSMPTGPACSWITDEELATAAGESLSSSDGAEGCTWSGDGLRVELSTVDDPMTLAVVDFAEDWPEYPEVVAEPANGLFFVDGDRAALLLDAGSSTVVVQVTDAGAGRLEHRDRLVAIAELLSA